MRWKWTSARVADAQVFAAVVAMIEHHDGQDGNLHRGRCDPHGRDAAWQVGDLVVRGNDDDNLLGCPLNNRHRTEISALPTFHTWRRCDDGDVSRFRAVLFDFSGTLFRLEEDDSWFAGMELIDDDGRRAVDEHVQAELMERLTHPTGGRSVQLTDEAYQAWLNRDLAPHLHREAYLHVLRDSGLPDHQARSLYNRVVDPAIVDALPRHRRGAALAARAQAQDRRRLQHRVRHPTGVPDRRSPRRRVRAVLRSRRRQTRPADLPGRARIDWAWRPRRRSWSATARRTTVLPAHSDATSFWSTRCLLTSGRPGSSTR